MKPRFRAEKVSSEELCIVQVICESNEQEFSLRGVKSKKISSHPGREEAVKCVFLFAVQPIT